MANLNKLKKYHFLYKTTNIKNGRFYIGIHSTNNLNDGYLGSGKRLRFSIRKHSKENFKLEILEFFENRELLVEREKELVNDELLKEPLCMNLKPGGSGGFSSETHRIKAQVAGAKKVNEIVWARDNHRKMHSDRMCNLWKNGVLTQTPWEKGKPHTEESKRKMSEAKKGKGTGKANSQFDTIWITNGTENKKIKKEEIIPIGWKKGRVIKK